MWNENAEIDGSSIVRGSAVSIQIKMPLFGNSVVEATVEEWLEKPGDSVAKYEALVVLVTDKVAVRCRRPLPA